MEKNNISNLLFVGIDPGTTLGYAVLDINGCVIYLHSSKLLDIKQLIRAISEIGLPVIVATDKANAPSFVRLIATKLGARLFYPKTDMLVKEKEELARGYNASDDHQRDALAAALLAYKKFIPLLEKIDSYIRANHKQCIESKLKRLMLLQDKAMSIKNTAEMIERPKKEQKKIMQNIIERRDFEKDYLRLYEKYRALVRETEIIKKQRRKLIDSKKNFNKALEKKDSSKFDKKIMDSINFKDRKISVLSRENKRLSRKVKRLNHKIESLKDIVLDMDDMKVIKAADNLGADFNKSWPVINKDDILMIRDCSVVSEKTLDSIKGLVRIIITAKPSRKLSDFLVINPKDLNIKEMDNIMLVKKAQLEKKINNKDFLKKIISDYKKRRN